MYRSSSGTTKPKFLSFDANTYIYDCPGFSDNKGPEQEIRNSFYISCLFEYFEIYKLIFVIENEDTRDRSNNFLELVNAMKSILGDAIHKNIGTASLIVNKVPKGQKFNDVKS